MNTYQYGHTAQACEYFAGCTNPEDIKVRYRELALRFHPDRGGDTRTMQEINAAYSVAIAQATRATRPGKTQEEYADLDSINEAIRVAIERIIRLQGIEIEVCGLWVWVTGDTFPVRADLKGAGYRFSHKKCSWYYAGIPCRSKQSHSMDYIRSHYGSQKVGAQDEREAISG